MTTSPQDKLSVLFLDHGTKPVGGGQINTLSLSRSMDRRKFTPIILSSAENSFTDAARANGIDVVLLPLPKSLTTLGRWSVKYDPYHLTLYAWHSVRAAFAIARIVRGRHIDILHPCDNLMRFLTTLVVLIQRTPVVCPIMEEFTPSLTSRLLRSLYLRTMDCVLPVSERVAVYFRQAGSLRARVVVTYTGIDLEQFTDESAAAGQASRAARYGNALVIGIVGRLIPIKGHRELFAALAAFKKSRERVFRCIVVGDGPDRADLERLALDLGLKEEIEFSGFHSDVSGVMGQMQILVAPSLNEASSRVVLEAGALGIPVVATKVGGLPEMVEDGVTGLLVEIDDIQGLATAIATLTDDATRLRMGEAGRRRVSEKFSNEVITRQVEQIYLSLSPR